MLKLLTSKLLQIPVIYSIWQAPFARQKFYPILQSGVIEGVESVLDIGCGPGTNYPIFKSKDYLGVDINADYINSASQKFGPMFQTVDARELHKLPNRVFDFVLINSLLHHLNDDDTKAVIISAKQQLHPVKGKLHILEPILPEKNNIAAFLAKYDRGKFFRSENHWKSIFSASLSEFSFEKYNISLCSIPLWNMFYAMGR